MTTIYARLKYFDGHTEEKCFSSWAQYFVETFSPSVETRDLIPIAVAGKTYAQKKEAASGLASDFQFLSGDADIGLSYLEIVNIQNAFYTLGRRYGLLTEFRENGIC